MECRHALIIKGDLAADEDVQDDAKAPHVDLRARVCFGLKELGSGEVQAPTEGLEVATGRKEVAETKVNNLNVARLADQDILNLEIAVDDAVAMAVVQGAGNLAAELPRLLLLESPM